MAAIFNGSSSTLIGTQSSATPTYPCLLCVWFKPTATSVDYVLAEISDNDSSGTLSALQLVAAGAQSGDHVRAVSIVDDSASHSASAGAFTAGGWQFAAAHFASASSRRVYFAGAWSTPETTTRTVTGITHLRIGGGAAGGILDGRIGEVAFFEGIDADLVDLTVRQLAAGLPGNEVWHTSPSLYQRLQGGANTSYRGPSMTPTSVTFESDDLPFVRRSDTGTGIPGGNESHEEVSWFRWDEPSDPVPRKRIAILNSDEKLELADASSANWIGVARSDSILHSHQRVDLRGAGRQVEVEYVGGATFTPGTSEAFLTADGKVDDAGTIAIGIVTHVRLGDARIVPY